MKEVFCHTRKQLQHDTDRLAHTHVELSTQFVYLMKHAQQVESQHLTTQWML